MKTRTKAPEGWKWIAAPKLKVNKPAAPNDPEKKERQVTPKEAFTLGKSGLAVHRMIGKRPNILWGITHINSGWSIAKRFKLQAEAREIAQRICLLIDWTGDQATVVEQGNKIGIAYQIKIMRRKFE
jgi:hypothetical protein